MNTLVARIRQAYDAVPYVSKAFQESAPERLRAVAHLFGLDSTPPDKARVLELGCAAGGNLIPFAVHHPHAEVVGVDLSEVQVNAGQRAIAAMGLNNLRLIHDSISNINTSLGKFDYIICHGVYSWVPEEVRDAILRVCGELLTPNGVAYVSYNTYPGWKTKEIIRDAMLLRGSNRATPAEQLSYARGMIDFLHDMAAPDSVLARVMSDNIDTIRNGEHTYLIHEFLETCNEPCYFRDFVGQAQQHGLGYLGEAFVGEMFVSNYGARVADPLLRECGNDQVLLEQMLDFVSNRKFRRTLLVRNERATQIDRKLNHQRIEALHVAGYYVASGEEGQWKSEGGKTIHVTDPVWRGVLKTMTAAWPATVPVRTLMDAARHDGGEAAATHVAVFIANLITANILQLFRKEPLTLPAQAGERPRMRQPLRQLVPMHAELGIGLFNEWHQCITIGTPIETYLLPYLDGEHDRAALVAVLVDAFGKGELTINRNSDGAPVTERAEQVVLAENLIEQTLSNYARSALLVP
jgi:methyltransferase-like protein/SAM-dependent methyltransferase